MGMSVNFINYNLGNIKIGTFKLLLLVLPHGGEIFFIVNPSMSILVMIYLSIFEFNTFL